jgi:hypothetical protein
MTSPCESPSYTELQRAATSILVARRAMFEAALTGAENTCANGKKRVCYTNAPFLFTPSHFNRTDALRWIFPRGCPQNTSNPSRICDVAQACCYAFGPRSPNPKPCRAPFLRRRPRAPIMRLQCLARPPIAMIRDCSSRLSSSFSIGWSLLSNVTFVGVTLYPLDPSALRGSVGSQHGTDASLPYAALV